MALTIPRAPGERMLPRVFRLEDPGGSGEFVEDLEGLCRGVLDAARKRARLPADFPDCDFDEALAFLIGESYIVARRYDPARAGRGGSFRGYVFDRLRFRLVDFLRTFYGRRGQHRLLPSGAEGDDGGDLMDEPLAPGPGDSLWTDWDVARRGYFESRDREGIEEVGRLGSCAARRPASGDRRAARAAA